MSNDMGNFRVFTFLAVIGVALTTSGADNLLNSIFFRFYKNDTHKDINVRNITLLNNELNSEKWTMFYIHGFSESVESESVKTVTNAYLTSTDINVVAIDYRQIAAENYLVAVGFVGAVAQVIGGALSKLEGNGLNKNKIHIVGHSLGGQVTGQVGVVVNFTVPRMTGLDPAGPLFYTGGRYLRASDAMFVDIIHTDKLFYGQPYNTGNVDFLPNFGHRLQPGCSPKILLTPDDYCSHHRSWRFYAESVKNPKGFLGVECNDDWAFLKGLCNNTNVVPMGFATPMDAKGTYYLTTHSSSPFAKGLQGTKV
ncbi:pancreatic triacylglycerol lipase-like [Augochlora pura]